MYNLVNNITGRFKVNPTPPGSDKVIAKDMADYFLSKMKKIRDDLATCCTYSPSSRDTAKLSLSANSDQHHSINAYKVM